jgi:hypothetical protein
MGFEESAPHTPVEARSGDTGPTDTASADAVADTAASVETREPSGPQPEPRPARGATAAIPVSSDSGAGNTAPITEAPEEVFAAPPSYGRSKLLLFGALAAGLLLVGAGSVLGYLYVEKKGPFAESTQAPSRAVASASETSERTESPDTEGSTPERTDDTPQKTAAADTPPASATSGSAEPEDVDERVDTPPPKSSVESKKKVVDDAPVETGSGSTSSDASEKRAKAISKKASSKKATSTKTADRPKTPLADKGDGGDTSPTSKKSDSPESSSPDDEAAKEDEASEPVEKTAEVSTDKTSDDASGDSKKSGYESLMNDAFE